MGNSRSPFDEGIAREWEQLVFLEGRQESLSERWARWERLYKANFKDGAWNVGTDDASLISSLGVTLAMEKGELTFARDLCQRFLNHPALSTRGDRVSIDFHRVRKGVLQILLGEVYEGVADLTSALKDGFSDRAFLLTLRNDLVSLLRELKPNGPADPRVASLVKDVVVQFNGLGLPGKTNGDLLATLMSTYPKKAPASPE